MATNKKIYTLLISAVSLFIGCRKKNCFDDIGAVRITQRSVAAFEQVAVHDNIDLFLLQDTLNRVEVEAGANQEPSLATDVRDGCLYLTYRPGCQWLRNANERVRVTVHVKNLKRLLYEGYGSVQTGNTLTGESFTVVSNGGAGNLNLEVNVSWLELNSFGNADYTISGKCEKSLLHIGARAKVDLRSLKARHMTLEYASVFDGYVQAQESLSATLHYKGNVYYTGRPAVTEKRYGDGRLILY